MDFSVDSILLIFVKQFSHSYFISDNLVLLQYCFLRYKIFNLPNKIHPLLKGKIKLCIPFQQGNVKDTCNNQKTNLKASQDYPCEH